MSIDYLIKNGDATPLLIDCNPRLVEPMNAHLSGVDLVGHLPGRGARSGARGPRGRPDPSLAMQVLLGCAAHGGTRRDIFREAWHISAACEPYAGSFEELTPVRSGWISAVPLALTATLLLAAPRRAESRLYGSVRGGGAQK
jgi:hypothetical protein